MGKNTLTDEKLKDKFEEADKTTIEDAAKEGLQFLESNPDASAEEYEAKQKEIEAKFNPIMQKVYQAAGGAPGGMPGGMPGGFPGAPGQETGGAPDAGNVDDLD